ncbi:hypothetical protein PG985_007981 [Apiospora marii]|uniref:uncharacterized protein n=1 Tax=Apiospora marii TaxID=335849 RepID=UPI00312F6995
MAATPSAEQIAYWKAHPEETKVPGIIACASVGAALSTVFVALRLVSQSLLQRRLWLRLSDWFIIAAWVVFVVFCITFAMTTKYGEGRHVLYVTDLHALQIATIIDEVTYCYTMAFIKLSILALYGTIFPSRKFRYILWFIGCVVVCWAITFSFAGIFQCIPISYLWDQNTGAFCIKYGVCSLVAAIINIITDFTILGLPIPLVWRLHTPRSKKILLTITFVVGGSACIVSIVRLQSTLQIGSTTDGSWDNVYPGYLSVIELAVGILAVSIPTYRPLYRLVVYGPDVPGQPSRPHQTSKATGSSQNNQSFQHQNPSRGVTISSDHSRLDSSPGVHVTNQIELVTHARRNGNWVKVPGEEATVMA